MTLSAATVNDTTTLTFDGSANSLFSRVTLTSNGGILEDFNKCNVYIPIVYDLTVNESTRNNYFSFFGNYSTPTGAMAVAAPDIESCKIGGQILSIGTTVALGANAVTLTQWRSFGFIIPSILGSFSKKLFPISEISGSNVDLDIYTDTLINSLVTSVAQVNNFTIQRLRLNLSVIEYNSTITEVIRRAYNHTYGIPCVSIQTYSNIFITS